MTGERRTQLSYACGSAEIPLLGKCIGQVLEDTAARCPDNEALVACYQQRRYTYRELNEEVDRAARGLLALGVQKGDRVGIWATNCAEWILTQFATAKIGAILVNVNPANRARELEYVLRQSECQLLLAIQGSRDVDYVEQIEQVCPEIRNSEPGKLESKDLPRLGQVIFLGAVAPPGMLAWQNVLRRGDLVARGQLEQREAELDFDDPINIQYTSGTTGFSKGATLSHHNLVNNALLVANAMRLTQGDRLCIPVPFYHCFGMVLGNMACVVSGATIVIPAAQFDAGLTLQAISQERCTAVHGVPTMFIAELEHRDFAKFDLSSLRTGIMAGAPCPIEVMKRVVKQMHCPEMTIAYGLTEASPVITQTTPDDPIERRVTTVGRALPHTEMKIIDPHSGTTVPVGTPGELCTRGYHVMKGYYNNPEATRASVDEDGWLHTGDLAVLDEDGYCNLTGRAKDIIIRGGENIYPREIEEFLYTYPGVSSVQVIGVPDRKYGEQVMAWVKLENGSTVTVEEIRAFCEAKLARYKVPHYIRLVDDFPMTITGKVQKFKMREIAVKELGLEAEAKIGTA